MIFLIGFYDDAFLISSKSRTLLLSIILFTLVYTIDVIQINEMTFFSLEKNLKINKFKIIFPTFCLLILMISCNLYDGINFQSFLFYFINFSFSIFLQENIFILTIIVSLFFFWLFKLQR